VLKKLSYLFLLVFVPVLMLAQRESDSSRNEQEKPNFKDRIYFDGNFNIGVGTSTFINLSPRVGYKITDNFSAGLGAKYWYFSWNDGFYRYSGSLYGGGVFARRNLTPNLFLTGEYELLNLAGLTSKPKEPFWNEFLFAGGGYQQNVGIINLYAVVLYDILQNPYSSYIYPTIPIAGVPIIFRLGINVGI
jgi:hypothetical protein